MPAIYQEQIRAIQGILRDVYDDDNEAVAIRIAKACVLAQNTEGMNLESLGFIRHRRRYPV